MIEIRNLKVYEDRKAVKENKFGRAHKKDTINFCTVGEFPDDNGQFVVEIGCKYSNDCSALFDSSEKAMNFYNALKAVLPDTDAQNVVIDHKDFE